MVRPNLYWAMKVALIMALLVSLLMAALPVAAQMATHKPTADELARWTNPGDYYRALSAEAAALAAGQDPAGKNSVCTIPDSTLAENPELVYSDRSQGC